MLLHAVPESTFYTCNAVFFFQIYLSSFYFEYYILTFQFTYFEVFQIYICSQYMQFFHSWGYIWSRNHQLHKTMRWPSCCWNISVLVSYTVNREHCISKLVLTALLFLHLNQNRIWMILPLLFMTQNWLLRGDIISSTSGDQSTTWMMY